MVETLRPASRADDKILPDKSGDNRFVSHNTIIWFAGQLRDAKREQRAATKKLSGLRKQFKNTGITLGVFDLVSDLAEQDDPDAFEKFFEEATHVAQAFGAVPPGTQLSFFDGPGSAASELETAKKKGFNRGLQGDNPDTQAYPENTELGQAHLAGWNEGQAVLQKEFEAHNKRQAELEAEKAEKKAADEKRKAAKAQARADKAAKKVPKTDDGETVQ